jgi:hypothetical protein
MMTWKSSFKFPWTVNHTHQPPGILHAEDMSGVIVDRMLDLERYFREGKASHITKDIKEVLNPNGRTISWA